MTRIKVLLALAVAVGPSGAAGGQSATRLIDPIDSLRNMREIGVVVEDIPALANLIRADALEDAVKRRLRQAGIQVPADDKKDPVSAFVPYLYANINAIRAEPDGYVYSISLQFKRPVEVHNIDRNRNFLFATTWDKAAIAIVPTNEYQSIERALDGFVTAFLDDYSTVNPAK